MEMKHTAVVTGVGSGLGASLVRKLVKEGYRVGMFARSHDYIRRLEQELNTKEKVAIGISTDISDRVQVQHGFQQVREQFGPIDLLINHAGNAAWKEFMALTPEDFEQSWRVCAYGSFLCTQEAVTDMKSLQRGTILFTGATSSIRGRKGALAFSSAKFAVRGLAESLARELWPHKIHVAHVIIDGAIDTPDLRKQESPTSTDPLLNPDEMAEAYWSLIQQPHNAWSLELDLRPFNEDFFT